MYCTSNSRLCFSAERRCDHGVLPPEANSLTDRFTFLPAARHFAEIHDTHFKAQKKLSRGSGIAYVSAPVCAVLRPTERKLSLSDGFDDQRRILTSTELAMSRKRYSDCGSIDFSRISLLNQFCCVNSSYHLGGA